MTLSLFYKLSKEEQDLLLASVDMLTEKLNELVNIFYYNFLTNNEEILPLFKDIDMNKQYNMFMVSIGFIITNIENPDALAGHMDYLIYRHIEYGVLPEHIPAFIEAFSKTIDEILDGTDPRTGIAWMKVIQNAMNYFKEKLSAQ